VRRWPQIVGTLALLAAVGSVGWRAAGQYEKPTAQLPTAPDRSATADSSSAPRSAEPARPASMPSTTVAASPVPPFAPGEIEVCGFGRAQADTSAAAQLAARANDRLEGSLAAHLRRMRTSGDERTRAAALMALDELPPLVTMAMRTNDPTVFALAQQGCLRRDWRDTGSPCALLNDEQGARLDPDNGAAWMRVADGARQRGESDNMVAALQRVATSPIHEPREFAFYALAMDALPADTVQSERVRVSIGLIGIQASLALSSHSAVTAHCTETLARDANRQPLCEALADHLVARGSLLIHVGIGSRIGERAGWSKERFERVRARFSAMQGALLEEIKNAPGGLVGCEAMRLAERWWIDAARIGERGVAERWLAEQNVTDAQLIERYRAQMARRASAAAAASAPK
jgi:hypothetical protein